MMRREGETYWKQIRIIMRVSKRHECGLYLFSSRCCLMFFSTPRCLSGKLFSWNILLFCGGGQCDQCDQMARLFFTHLAVFCNENLLIIYSKYSQESSKLCQIFNLPQKIAKDFWYSSKVTKFRHLLQKLYRCLLEKDRK